MEWQAQEMREDGRCIGGFVPEELRDLAVEQRARLGFGDDEWESEGGPNEV
jgi:hypothetical protein